MNLRTPCDAVNHGGLSCPRPAKFNVRVWPNTVQNTCGTHLGAYVAEGVKNLGATTVRPTEEVAAIERDERMRQLSRWWVEQNEARLFSTSIVSKQERADMELRVGRIMHRAIEEGRDDEAEADGWLWEQEEARR